MHHRFMLVSKVFLSNNFLLIFLMDFQFSHESQSNPELMLTVSLVDVQSKVSVNSDRNITFIHAVRTREIN